MLFSKLAFAALAAMAPAVVSADGHLTCNLLKDSVCVDVMGSSGGIKIYPSQLASSYTCEQAVGGYCLAVLSAGPGDTGCPSVSTSNEGLTTDGNGFLACEPSGGGNTCILNESCTAQAQTCTDDAPGTCEQTTCSNGDPCTINIGGTVCGVVDSDSTTCTAKSCDFTTTPTNCGTCYGSTCTRDGSLCYYDTDCKPNGCELTTSTSCDTLGANAEDCPETTANQIDECQLPGTCENVLGTDFCTSSLVSCTVENQETDCAAFTDKTCTAGVLKCADSFITCPNGISDCPPVRSSSGGTDATCSLSGGDCAASGDALCRKHTCENPDALGAAIPCTDGTHCNLQCAVDPPRRCDAGGPACEGQTGPGADAQCVQDPPNWLMVQQQKIEEVDPETGRVVQKFSLAGAGGTWDHETIDLDTNEVEPTAGPDGVPDWVAVTFGELGSDSDYDRDTIDTLGCVAAGDCPTIHPDYPTTPGSGSVQSPADEIAYYEAHFQKVGKTNKGNEVTFDLYARMYRHSTVNYDPINCNFSLGSGTAEAPACAPEWECTYTRTSNGYCPSRDTGCASVNTDCASGNGDSGFTAASAPCQPSILGYCDNSLNLHTESTCTPANGACTSTNGARGFCSGTPCSPDAAGKDVTACGSAANCAAVDCNPAPTCTPDTCTTLTCTGADTNDRGCTSCPGSGGCTDGDSCNVDADCDGGTCAEVSSDNRYDATKCTQGCTKEASTSGQCIITGGSGVCVGLQTTCVGDCANCDGDATGICTAVDPITKLCPGDDPAKTDEIKGYADPTVTADPAGYGDYRRCISSELVHFKDSLKYTINIAWGSNVDGGDFESAYLHPSNKLHYAVSVKSKNADSEYSITRTTETNLDENYSATGAPGTPGAHTTTAPQTIEGNGDGSTFAPIAGSVTPVQDGMSVDLDAGSFWSPRSGTAAGDLDSLDAYNQGGKLIVEYVFKAGDTSVDYDPTLTLAPELTAPAKPTDAPRGDADIGLVTDDTAHPAFAFSSAAASVPSALLVAGLAVMALF